MDKEVSAFLESSILVLSPHADDAVLSCGGLLLQHDDALVVTVCSGQAESPRPKYLASMASVETRMREDRAAMQKLGCKYQALDLLDAVDRSVDGEPVYRTPSELFGAVSPNDTPVFDEIFEKASALVAGRVVLCPMGVGAHVDHQLCAHVGRRLQKAGQEVWFYPDAPYCFPDSGPKVRSDTSLLASRRLRARIWSNRAVEIDWQAKSELVAEYSSQVVELFGDLVSYQYFAEDYFHHIGGTLELYHQLRW